MKPGLKRALLLVAFAALVACALVLLAAYLLPPPGPIERPASLVVTDKNGGWLRAFASVDGGMWRVPIARGELPQHVVDAVLTFEDARFYHHPGIDPLALARATWSNIAARRVVSGASTLTMQLARMIDPKPRTLSSKLLEMFQALQLETHYSKDQVLIAYLNIAPYGGNIEGLGAAAYFYYGKNVSQLTRDEAAVLAAIPNSPVRFRPDGDNEALRARRDEVLARMAARGLISEQDLRSAIALPVIARRRSAPMIAPHLAERVRRLDGAHGKMIGKMVGKMISSIDPELQRRAQAIVESRSKLWSSRGVGSASVVIIENETRKVRALVGSPSFSDRAHDGEVDGTNAMRSPGSTLKPFVYAMALDRGLIGTGTLLQDLPLHFKDWSPKNFDDSFRGVITAEDALKTSLNIPAVHLAQELEPRGVVELLRTAGFRGFQDRDRALGLSVVLGGCEVTLLELTNLYATLASGGEHRAPSLLEEEPLAPAERLFSEGAAYLISEVLTDVRRPELSEDWKDTSTRKMTWKTGTSYGHRDAWTVGYDARYTVGVWVGNFDGSGVPELVGAHAAAPLFFAIAEALPQTAWFAQPTSVKTREVCALSGMIAGPNCPHRKVELALEDRAPATTCTLHQAIDVDDQTGYRLCPRCRSGRAHHAETHVVWPNGIAQFFAASGLATDKVPDHNPRCKHLIGGAGPAITLPLDGEELVLRDGIPANMQSIALSASTESGHDKLYWFVDGALLAAVQANAQVLYDPERGAHEIVAVDAEGRKSHVRIRVR